MELGALRTHRDRCYEILKEYEMLGESIFDFLAMFADRIPRVRAADFWPAAAYSQAIELIRQATMSTFSGCRPAQINERENRLRGSSHRLARAKETTSMHLQRVHDAVRGLVRWVAAQGARRGHCGETLRA